jgi:hypothetical protein
MGKVLWNVMRSPTGEDFISACAEERVCGEPGMN